MPLDSTGAQPVSRPSAREVSPEAASLIPAWVHSRLSPGFRLVSAVVDRVPALDAPAFRRQVADAFGAIFDQLGSQHPVRFWAFLPGIHDELAAGLDRYMAFNAGRYDSFAAYYRPAPAFAATAPTASAVGVRGDRLTLHCLGADEPGRSIENPRQVSAYQYSRRYGPVPPCFARATLIRHAGRQLLLVGGTASITGEHSRHVGAIDGQVEETLRNLASVVASASERVEGRAPERDEMAAWLRRFAEIRVYFREPAHRRALDAVVSERFHPGCRIEWMHASLCRPELLVEIEGVAYLDAERPAAAGRA